MAIYKHNKTDVDNWLSTNPLIGGEKKKKKKKHKEEDTKESEQLSKEEIMSALDSKFSRISPGLMGDRGPSSTIKEVEPDPAITTVTPNAPSKDKKRKKKKEKEKSNLPFGKRVKYGIQDLFTRQNKQKAIYTGAGRTVKRKRQGRR